MIWRALALIGILPAGATPYFWAFWHWFDFWRRRRLLWFVMLGGTFSTLAAVLLVLHRWTFSGKVHLPIGLRILGWILLAIVTVFGTIADRQIGIRIRSFAPFFEREGHLELKTTGAYGVVRHPIYAAGVGEGLAIFLVTGFPAVLVAWAIFTLGALWFTKREEEKLITLLDDPAEYERYRERVPALFPRLKRSSASPRKPA